VNSKASGALLARSISTIIAARTLARDGFGMKSIRPMFENASGLSRRDLLWTGAAASAFLAPAVAGLAIAQNHGDGGSTDMQGQTGRGVPRAPYDKNAALIEPEVRRSASGELRTNLRVGYTYKDIGGYRLSLRSYEGTIPGPTLRVKPGDVLRIRLSNALPPNPDPTPVDMSLPHHFNTTNLHFHGGHVSPDGIADNVFRSMEPAQSYDIEIAIPKDPSNCLFVVIRYHAQPFKVNLIPSALFCC
jgi:FtsP/CotA-like multicopper oxidase with cupredoxin domain